MNSKEILANGPQGWTHVELFETIEPQNFYLKRTDISFRYSYFNENLNEWVKLSLITGNIRSRADIERIVELEKALLNIYIDSMDMGDHVWVHTEVFDDAILKGIKP